MKKYTSLIFPHFWELDCGSLLINTLALWISTQDSLFRFVSIFGFAFVSIASYVKFDVDIFGGKNKSNFDISMHERAAQKKKKTYK